MKTIKWAIALLFLCLLAPLRAAVVITEITVEEYVALSATTQAFKSNLLAGFSSLGTPEVSLKTDITISADHIWSVPEQIEFQYDMAGNATFRVGSTVLVDQPLSGFNAILIQIKDNAPLNFQTDFSGLLFNDVELRDMFAKRTMKPTDQILITGFGSTVDFAGVFYKNPASFGDSSSLTITGVMVPGIPEATAAVFFGISCFTLLLRRKR